MGGGDQGRIICQAPVRIRTGVRLNVACDKNVVLVRTGQEGSVKVLAIGPTKGKSGGNVRGVGQDARGKYPFMNQRWTPTRCG